VVFFDLGWTLEDEGPAQWVRAQQTSAYARNRGLEIDPQQLLDLQVEAGAGGVPSVYPAALARLGLGPGDHRELRRLFPWNPDLNRLYPEVPSVLPALDSRGLLGIIANQSRPMGPRLTAYGIDRFFPIALCSCELGYDKPDPKIFVLAEERALALGDPGPHWMVGDRIDNDVVPARARGWKTYRVVRGDYRLQCPQSASETPDAQGPDLTGVPAAVFPDLGPVNP
jgi:FMN phosphatase YigB (HAD superfamily)